ncbi:MAG: calcium-binding protein [Desulfovibrionaceae bacterium]
MESIAAGVYHSGNSDDETVFGTGEGDTLLGYGGDDTLFGGSGNDTINGGAGADVISGGDGNDRLDGGYNDGENDVVFGGEGNDTFYWGPAKDGSDYFDGGEGDDTIKLDLSDYGVSSLQDAYEQGLFSISIEGDPDYEPTFNNKGQIVFPEGASGTITGPTGETLTFTDVEYIAKY